jgi:hypothetical protein
MPKPEIQSRCSSPARARPRQKQLAVPCLHHVDRHPVFVPETGAGPLLELVHRGLSNVDNAPRFFPSMKQSSAKILPAPSGLRLAGSSQPTRGPRFWAGDLAGPRDQFVFRLIERYGRLPAKAGQPQEANLDGGNAGRGLTKTGSSGRIRIEAGPIERVTATWGVALPRTRGEYPPYSLPAFLKRKRRLAALAGRLSLCRPLDSGGHAG